MKEERKNSRFRILEFEWNARLLEIINTKFDNVEYAVIRGLRVQLSKRNIAIIRWRKFGHSSEIRRSVWLGGWWFPS